MLEKTFENLAYFLVESILRSGKSFLNRTLVKVSDSATRASGEQHGRFQF